MTRLNFTFQESSPLITYLGWVEGSPSNDTLTAKYDGSFRVTFTADATASFKFNGTGVSLFGSTRSNHGNYSVGLDQQPLFVESGATGQNFFNKSLWHADNLDYKEHTVVLKNIPTGAGPFLDLDYISIERQIGKDGDKIFQTTFDDAAPAPAVRYLGSWQQETDRNTANAGTLHTTIAAGSQAVITFNGCCVELYGHYTNAPYSVTLDNHPPVNLAGVDVDLPPNLQHPRTLLYLVDGLPEGQHTVTLTNTKSNVNRPFFFDYAVASSTQDISSLPPSKQTPGAAPTGALGGNKNPIGAIVGALFGAIALAAVLIFLLLSVRRRLWRREEQRVRRNLDPLGADFVDPSELEPKPYILPPKDVESQGASPDGVPRLNHSPSRDHPPPSKYQMPTAHPQAASPSSDGLLGPQEQSSAGGSRSYSTPSSTWSRKKLSEISTPRPAFTRRVDPKSGTPGGESSQYPTVQEEDAGAIIPSADQSIARALPPAYNPEWHRFDDS